MLNILQSNVTHDRRLEETLNLQLMPWKTKKDDELAELAHLWRRWPCEAIVISSLDITDLIHCYMMTYLSEKFSQTSCIENCAKIGFMACTCWYHQLNLQTVTCNPSTPSTRALEPVSSEQKPLNMPWNCVQKRALYATATEKPPQ